MSSSLLTNFSLIARKRPVFLLFLIFSFSVLLRAPQLTRSLSKHFEFNTALVLISSDVWQQNGFPLSTAAPVHRYRGEYNIPAALYKGPFQRLSNSGTYLSIGPGSYWFPYFYFQIFHITPSVAGLRIFNLILQFTSVFLIYQLAFVLIKKKHVPLIAGIIAIFCPVAMWYQGNAYCHEIAVIPMYLGLLLMLHSLWNKRHSSAGWHVGFAVLLYAAILTDWLPIFFCFVVVCLQLFQKWRKNEYNSPLVIIILITATTAVITIVYIYNNVVGPTELWSFAETTFLHRSFIGKDITTTRNSFLNIFIFLLSGYGLVIPFILCGLLNTTTRKKILNAHPVIIIAAVTPLLHYIIFYNFANEHDYAPLKWLGIFPIAYAYILTTSTMFSAFYRLTAFIICIVSACIIYYAINLPGKTSRTGEPYDWCENAGKIIAQHTTPDEYIFSNQTQEFSQLNWYAKRQTIIAKDSTEAQKILDNLAGIKAVFFELNQFTITRIIHLQKKTLQGVTTK